MKKINREQLINFFTWINSFEELKYTELGINFYVDEFIKNSKKQELEEKEKVIKKK